MWTIVRAAEAIKTGKLTPVDLLEECLARVDALEDMVHAWVFVARDEAREQARELTAELQQGRHRGPLHGIPIAVKDIFDVFDWPTAAGSKLWANSIARQDSTVVERLRNAGAVLMGKTVTTAYASFDPPVTRNPWNLSKTPGGSSSGSAVAIACGMCLGALASQTGGSITRPASYCGVCSIKPTYGRVSLAGVLPLAPTLDHGGVMARCVRDVALLYRVIAGLHYGVVPDPLPPIDRLLAQATVPGFTLHRFGGLFDEKAEPVMRQALAHESGPLSKLSNLSAEWLVPPAGFSDILPRHRMMMAVEAASYHETRLRRHPEDYPPCIRQLLEEGLSCSAVEYQRTRSHRDHLEAEMENMLGKTDVLLTPATTGLAPDAATTGDPAFNSPWSYTGLPTVSLPCAWTADGLPLALQLVGKRWSEDRLLSYAAWCERAIGFEAREVAC